MSKIKTVFPVFVLSLLLFTACCSCGSNDENIIKGIITIVGNDPFARLAIKTLENDKAYVLDCSKELKEKLWKEQGEYYAIQFSSSRIEIGLPVLVVEKAIPLNPKTKN